jgi:hypothetical protein
MSLWAYWKWTAVKKLNATDTICVQKLSLELIKSATAFFQHTLIKVIGYGSTGRPVTITRVIQLFIVFPSK